MALCCPIVCPSCLFIYFCASPLGHINRKAIGGEGAVYSAREWFNILLRNINNAQCNYDNIRRICIFPPSGPLWAVFARRRFYLPADVVRSGRVIIYQQIDGFICLLGVEAEYPSHFHADKRSGKHP